MLGSLGLLSLFLDGMRVELFLVTWAGSMTDVRGSKFELLFFLVDLNIICTCGAYGVRSDII